MILTIIVIIIESSLEPLIAAVTCVNGVWAPAISRLDTLQI